MRRCGLVGVGMVLLEEVCHCGGGPLDLIYAQVTPSDSDYFLLPSNQDVVYLATTPPPCRHACCLASHHDNNGLNL